MYISLFCFMMSNVFSDILATELKTKTCSLTKYKIEYSKSNQWYFSKTIQNYNKNVEEVTLYLSLSNIINQNTKETEIYINKVYTYINFLLIHFSKSFSCYIMKKR